MGSKIISEDIFDWCQNCEIILPQNGSKKEDSEE